MADFPIGTALPAIQVVARAQKAGLKLTPYDLFMHPTVASLAEVATAGARIDAEQGDVSGPVPLVPAQRTFCVSGADDPHHCNASVLLDRDQRYEPRVVGEAVEHLLGHHDATRTPKARADSSRTSTARRSGGAPSSRVGRTPSWR